MIEHYKTHFVEGPQGQPLGVLDRVGEPCKGSWVSVVGPGPQDREWLQDVLGVSEDFLRSALDDEETARIEYDEDTRQTLVIIDCPFVEEEADLVDQGIVQYDTHPLAILFLPVQDVLVTVTLRPNDAVQAVVTGRIREVNTAQRSRFLLQVLLYVSQRYQTDLRSVSRQFRENERRLRKSMRSSDLVKMLGFEKSLVYFESSLKQFSVLLERIRYGRAIRMYEDDRDLLEDVMVEVRQAREMCEIDTEVLNQTMDTFSTIINNNMNDTMYMLAIITLVLSVPTMVYGFYGMNTPLPADQSWWFPLALSVALSALSYVWLTHIHSRPR